MMVNSEAIAVRLQKNLHVIAPFPSEAADR